MSKEKIYEYKYKTHLISISEENELIIDGVIHDKDTGLPVGIPLLTNTNLHGKIRKITAEDVAVKVSLRHTGIGTKITIYLNGIKVDSKHVIAALF